MKEYRSRNSGRYVFNEDMHNLQELALSPVELFRDCGLDFVISGCAIAITRNDGLYTINVASGYVYLDGKIREVPAFSGTAASVNSIGIYATQPTAPQITYFNGDTDFMYNDYAAEIRVNFDNSDSIKCVMAQQNGRSLYAFPNLRTGFFNHYCIMNNGTIGHVGSLAAGEIDVTTLKINNSNITSLFVQKSGDTMSDDAALTFVKRSNRTVITGESIAVDGTITAENLTLSGISIITGGVTAGSFIKNGGTSSQFLKADGSVDGTVYATNDRVNTINERFSNYLLLTGGTLSGKLTANDEVLVSGSLTLQSTLIGVDVDLTGYVIAQKLNATGEIIGATGEIRGALNAGSAQIANALIAGSAQITSTLVVGSTITVNSTATINGDTNVNANVTAIKFIKTGGTANQFLKANGDVDSNSYALTSSLNDYLPLTGGTLTGALTVNNANVTAIKFIKTGGTANQFLKANGDVDSTSYLPLTGGTLTGALTCQSGITSNQFIHSSGGDGFLKANGSVDDNTYLTQTNAADTYLTQNNAANTYLTQNNAENVYATITRLDDYVKKNDLFQLDRIIFFGSERASAGQSVLFSTTYTASGITYNSDQAPFTISPGISIYGDTYISGEITASGFNTSSDERLKEKTEDVVLSLEQIANAPAIKFKWKNSNKGNNIGTVAQYWQNIIPEVVGNSNDYLTLNYSAAAMVSVISLAKEVVALKKEIAELKSQTN